MLGQYAIYRARRYRLTRTIYRGLRFHQSGSAWSYAIRATLWWIATIVTLGLAYPFQMASLERYKMRNTFYGDLAGRFEASGFALLLRGLPMWLLFFAPLALAIRGFVGIDWQALIDAIAQGGDDVMSKIEGGNPGLGSAIVFAMLMGGTSIVVGALLYPAFQALILRWWSSGLRFGGIEVDSRLRTRDVYGAYARFVGYASLFSIAMGIIGAIVLFMAGAVVSVCKTRFRRTDRDNPVASGGLRDHRTWFLNHLSRHSAAVAVAVGHGIAGIIRSFGAREGPGRRQAEFRPRRGSRRRPECWRLLMPEATEGPLP